MSRLGDLLQTERLRREMTLKQVAKTRRRQRAVPEGRRGGESGIISDEQARRILKKIGLNEQTEQGFTLDDIAATVDLQTVSAPKAKRMTTAEPAPPRGRYGSVFSDGERERRNGAGSVWLDALDQRPKARSRLQRRDGRDRPPPAARSLQGRIEGAVAGQGVLLSDAGRQHARFRILKGDLCFTVPAGSPIDGAVMLAEMSRGTRVYAQGQESWMRCKYLLQSYDREYAAEPCALPDINIIGHVVRVEFSLVKRCYPTRKTTFLQRR